MIERCLSSQSQYAVKSVRDMRTEYFLFGQDEDTAAEEPIYDLSFKSLRQEGTQAALELIVTEMSRRCDKYKLYDICPCAPHNQRFLVCAK